MRCSACGFENRDAAKFCLGCGQRFAVTCARCAAELPVDARFCDQCGQPVATAPFTAGPQPGGSNPRDYTPAHLARGAVDSQESIVDSPRAYTPRHLAEKILHSRSALEGERKQVTVLFADVVGSTALAERLDPEEMHGIMDRCFRLLTEEVHRYEGTVNQFTGDGIMALFGAPIAHEDAPERAVRAALGMQASLKRCADDLERERGIDFRMRIGINTGPVVVGKIGDDLRMDYTAIGDTTNLAARLQTAAEPGTILISEQTAKLVAGRFVTRAVGPLTLKGKSEPVTAQEVLRTVPRTPLVALSERGLTPLVGRASELAALDTVFRNTQSGRGQIVFVVGEAGIGKSRLIYEFRRRIGDQEAMWLHGRCISFGRGIPLLPVIDVLKQGFAIDEADDDRTIIEKIRDGVDALGPELKFAEPYLRTVLAVDPGDPSVAAMDASARRFATFEALKRVMLASAARQPLVVLIEDLHWIDPASEEYLTYIVDAIAGSRVLLLCTFRPGYRPQAFGDRSYITRLALQPLSREETAVMAAAMLEAPDFPAELRTLLINKAEGNPFFIEEVTKSLLEIGALRRTPAGYALGRPVSEIVIPNTIQDVIMARIDRLGDESKRAIQVASVIGREFAVRLLQRASELGEGVNALVGELRALELIYEKFGMPELAYMFKHALTHDVAYESLLMQRRKQLHCVIGCAIEELYADRLPEHWETLAYHFDRGEDWQRAFEYLVKAADKARAAFANSEAVNLYDRALVAAAHLEIDAQRRAAIYEAKGHAHVGISEFPEAVEAYEQALRLTSSASDRARIDAALAEALLWAHQFDAAIAAADEAVTLARSADNASVISAARYAVGFVRMVRGDLDGAVQCLTEVSRLTQTTGQRALHAMVRLYGTARANWAGDYGVALQPMDELLAHLKELNELLYLAEAYSHFAITLGGAGDYRRMFPSLADGIALSESIGDKVWRARMWNTRGWVLGELGAFEAADEANRRCLEIAGQLGGLRMTSELIGNAETNLADVALARGDLVGAEPHLAAVAAILGDRRNEWMTWRYGMHYQLTAAELSLARGDLAAARRYIETGRATAERTASRRYLVRAARLLAACHVAGGNLTEAERLLATTVRDARTLGNPPQLWHTLLAYGRVLHAVGHSDEAALAWHEGLDLLRQAGAALPNDVRAALQSSPLHSTFEQLTV